MPSKSLVRRIEETRRRVTTDRYQSLGLRVFYNGAVIVQAGGVWDSLLWQYDPAQEPEWHDVHLVSSQEKAARQLASWFLDFERDAPNRKALEIYVDNRRGGKTWWTVLAVLLFALRYPRVPTGKTVTWVVVPAFSQQREIHAVIRRVLPVEWERRGLFVYHKAENFYEFTTGVQLWIKSADRPFALKQGEVACVAVNEMQQISDEAAANCLGANIDSGGITFGAMNPPDSVKGLYLENLHNAIHAVDEAGNPLLPFARETEFPAAKNEAIDQNARSRFGRLLEVISPQKARRDALGFWVSIKDRAYPHYNAQQHIGKAPDWRDITSEVNGLTEYLQAGEIRTKGGGMDFQHKPYCVYIEAKILMAPAGVWLPEGTPLFVITWACANDFARGEFWSEELLAQKVLESGRNPKDILLIADATGHFQGASFSQRGRQADPATYSYPLLEQFGFEPHAPLERVSYHRVRGRGTEIKKGLHNPTVPVRLNLVNRLLYERRVLIERGCPDVPEAFRKCEAKNKHPFGWGAHHTDSVGYLLFRWETTLIERGLVKVTETTQAAVEASMGGSQ